MADVTSKVLFVVNEHMATEALLGDAFAEQGFDGAAVGGGAAPRGPPPPPGAAPPPPPPPPRPRG